MKKTLQLKEKKLNIFQEEYLVNLDYQKPDGYWVCSHEELVRVPVQHGVNEKNNHDQAENIAKIIFPGCRVNKIMYC